MVTGTPGKRVTAVVLSVAVLSAALASRAIVEPPVPWAREGDRSAAAFADTHVLTHVKMLAAAGSDPPLPSPPFLHHQRMI